MEPTGEADEGAHITAHITPVGVEDEPSSVLEKKQSVGGEVEVTGVFLNGVLTHDCLRPGHSQSIIWPSCPSGYHDTYIILIRLF